MVNQLVFLVMLANAGLHYNKRVLLLVAHVATFRIAGALLTIAVLVASMAESWKKEREISQPLFCREKVKGLLG